jgi:hypothetical protein
MLDKKEQRIISISLNSLNKLNILKELEQKEYEKEIKRESQLLVSASKVSALIDTL